MKKWIISCLIAEICSGSVIYNAQADTLSVRVWLRAFIPASFSGADSIISKTNSGTYVIQAPGLIIGNHDFGPYAGSCFATDNRGFSPDINASSRVMADFEIVFSGRRSISVKLPSGRDAFGIIGETHNVDCKTGNDVRPPLSASKDSVMVGDVKASNFLRVFNVKVSAGNPFYFGLAPKIDLEFAIQYDMTSTKLLFHGTGGAFPAFEGYYQINGKTSELFQLPPAPGGTPINLSDLFLGLNQRSFDYKIDLTNYLNH